MFIPFCLQITLDLHTKNGVKLRSKFCFLQNETFLAKRVPAVSVSYIVYLINVNLLYLRKYLHDISQQIKNASDKF